jgi:DNA-binding MarR family transcriptional regulator
MANYYRNDQKLTQHIAAISFFLQEIGSDLYIQAFRNQGMAACSLVQFRYLELIYRKKANTVTDLSAVFTVKKPTAAKIVKILEKRNLIKKQKSKKDGRIYNLMVTKQTLNIFEHRQRMYKMLADKIGEILQQEEFNTLTLLFSKITAALQQNIEHGEQPYEKFNK